MPSNFFSSAHAAIFSTSSSNSRQVYLVISPLESAIDNTLCLFYPKISCRQRALYMNVDASPHVLRWRLLTLKFLSIKAFRGFLKFSLKSHAKLPKLFLSICFFHQPRNWQYPSIHLAKRKSLTISSFDLN